MGDQQLYDSSEDEGDDSRNGAGIDVEVSVCLISSLASGEKSILAQFLFVIVFFLIVTLYSIPKDFNSSVLNGI